MRSAFGFNMNHRTIVALLMALALAGCGGSSSGPRERAPTPDALPDKATADGLRDKDDQRRAQEPERVTLGPFSFTPPANWEVRRDPPPMTIFAPERPAWREAGFRPNLGFRTRPHPGVSLERYRDMLDQLLRQSAEQVNSVVNQFAKQSGEGDGTSVVLKETGKYTLVPRDIGGARVLSTTFTGVHQLPSGVVATKTYGIQLIGTDALYTISLTFPRSAENEMDGVWKAFEQGLRIER
jgi:hypothetical protein